MKDLIARAVYDDYDDYLEKQGGSFLFRTLQGGLTNYTNTALATYSPQEQPKSSENDLFDDARELLNDAQEYFFGAEEMVTQNNQLAALQQENPQPSGPPEGAPSLSEMQASAYGIEPGAMVDTLAGSILGGIDGITFDDDMRASLGVETVGRGDPSALPITTDSPDSLAYLENLNQHSVAENNQTSHPDAQYLEDAMLSGDVLVRGFNETEAVITNEVLSNGDVTSKQYEIDYADYESINQATYESDLFDFDVGNGFADSEEINPFTQLYGDISSSLTEYGNYASVSFDEFVGEQVDYIGDKVDAVTSVVSFGINVFDRDLIEPFRDSTVAGLFNLVDRAFYLPAGLLDVSGASDRRGAYSLTVAVEAESGINASLGPVENSFNVNTGVEVGFSFNTKGDFVYTNPKQLGGYLGLGSDFGLTTDLKSGVNKSFKDVFWNNANVSLGLTALSSGTAIPDELLSGVSIEHNANVNLSARHRTLSLGTVDTLLTSIQTPKLDRSDSRIFYQDLLGAGADLVENDWKVDHRASGFSLSLGLTPSKHVSASVEQSWNTTIQYEPITFNNGQNIIKTGAGIVRGWHDIYNLVVK